MSSENEFTPGKIIKFTIGNDIEAYAKILKEFSREDVLKEFKSTKEFIESKNDEILKYNQAWTFINWLSDNGYIEYIPDDAFVEMFLGYYGELDN